VNYYDILGVEKNADSESIKKAYKKLAKQYHPDLNPKEVESSEEHFKKINEAYHVLIDEKERKKYDQFGSEYVPRKAPQWQATNIWTNNTWDYIR
jgi:curved DNA-binding protein CbpA